MNIISSGDCIVSGNYQLHSKFEKVVNFSNGKKLLSFVTKVTGNGPVNIVVNNIDAFKKPDEILLKNHVLIYGANIFKLQNYSHYNSGIDEIKFDQNIISENIIKLLLILIKQSAPLSLAFIFDKSRINNFFSSFEKKFIQKVNSAIEKIKQGEIIKGIEMLRGCGFGFTPSGDDFITGMLNAFYIIHKISGKQDLVKLRRKIYLTAQTENIISHNAIHFASKGRFNEVFKALIFSLNEDNDELLKKNTIKLLQTGETSGADTLTGFLFTFVNKNTFVNIN
ncbi:MAG: DUF2877 domain-containing protein [Bacteroidetes bacterium]|nr:DUF2877 domain-containing protein [Bacteroidota bacterium]